MTNGTKTISRGFTLRIAEEALNAAVGRLERYEHYAGVPPTPLAQVSAESVERHLLARGMTIADAGAIRQRFFDHQQKHFYGTDAAQGACWPGQHRLEDIVREGFKRAINLAGLPTRDDQGRVVAAANAKPIRLYHMPCFEFMQVAVLASPESVTMIIMTPPYPEGATPTILDDLDTANFLISDEATVAQAIGDLSQRQRIGGPNPHADLIRDPNGRPSGLAWIELPEAAPPA